MNEDRGIGFWGDLFRGLRGWAAASSVSEAAVSLIDRLVESADEADVQRGALEVAARDASAAISTFLVAAFDGLSEDEAVEMLAALEPIYQARSVVDRLM